MADERRLHSNRVGNSHQRRARGPVPPLGGRGGNIGPISRAKFQQGYSEVAAGWHMLAAEIALSTGTHTENAMLKVLIAEDELMTADLMEDFLTRNGYDVCGIARTVDEGVALAELHKPDLAVLDVRLARGDRGPEIVRRLNSSRGKLGVLYATGDDARNSTLTVSDGEASIAKPYRPEDLVRALVIVREIVTGGTATPPFPSGFRLLPESATRVAQAGPA